MKNQTFAALQNLLRHSSASELFAVTVGYDSETRTGKAAVTKLGYRNGGNLYRGTALVREAKNNRGEMVLIGSVTTKDLFGIFETRQEANDAKKAAVADYLRREANKEAWRTEKQRDNAMDVLSEQAEDDATRAQVNALLARVATLLVSQN